MDTKKICIYCLSGTLRGGVCPYCGKTAAEETARAAASLPARYALCGGQYYLGRVLGSGGYGITYLARDMKHQHRVAVKEFFPRHLASRGVESARVQVMPEGRTEFKHTKMRFKQEAQTLYELRSIAEIINVYHLFEENGTAYYVMEFLEGRDLRSYLHQNGPMQWNQLQKPLGMILRALHFVHEKQMIHRDISPDNIFILPDGGAKLIDFGNARNYMVDEPLTQILKARFAPVEQQSESYGKQGPWTDIYSLSVTLYYALSGVLPASSIDRQMSKKQGYDDPIKPISELRPDIPMYIAGAIHKGMEVSAEQRYHTVQEFAEQLFPGSHLLDRSENRARQFTAKPVQPAVCCVAGILKGRQVQLKPGVTKILGRSPEAAVVYPADSSGISRHQCAFMMDGKGIVYVRDENSSYGTILNGKQMAPMKWYPAGRGSVISFAKEQYRIL